MIRQTVPMLQSYFPTLQLLVFYLGRAATPTSPARGGRGGAAEGSKMSKCSSKCVAGRAGRAVHR